MCSVTSLGFRAKGKTTCVSVDLQKAYDLINRDVFINKLILSGADGTFSGLHAVKQRLKVWKRVSLPCPAVISPCRPRLRGSPCLFVDFSISDNSY